MASKNRRNKVKFKWTKELIFLIVALVAILTATIVLALPTTNDRLTDKINEQITNYNSNNSTEYSTLSNDNVFVEIDSYDEFKKAINTSDYAYIYYGVYSNATFLEQISKINTAASNNEVKKVYIYLATEVDETEDKDATSFKRLMAERTDEASNGAASDVKNVDFTVYPSLFVYKDNKLVFNSQTDEGDELSWSIYINKAFTLGKEVENN